MKKIGILFAFTIAITMSTFAFSDSNSWIIDQYLVVTPDANPKVISGPDAYVNWTMYVEATGEYSQASASITLDYGVTYSASASESATQRRGGMHNGGSDITMTVNAVCPNPSGGNRAIADVRVYW